MPRTQHPTTTARQARPVPERRLDGSTTPARARSGQRRYVVKSSAPWAVL